ncbi:hypothetical protein L484_014297 [Morus notabilis]|uniref:Uncharacterized protein n=1 Tax=Morus notabilis TaxID=981085 RepID=W9RBT3_9ROSA|nr:hypothetical protein L484_014297 [Morus notabilis]
MNCCSRWRLGPDERGSQRGWARRGRKGRRARWGGFKPAGGCVAGAGLAGDYIAGAGLAGERKERGVGS